MSLTIKTPLLTIPQEKRTLSPYLQLEGGSRAAEEQSDDMFFKSQISLADTC